MARRLPPWWPWPLAAILAVVLVWMLAGRGGSASDSGGGAPAAVRRWPEAVHPPARPAEDRADLARRVRRAIGAIVESHGKRLGVFVGGPAPGEDLYESHADASFVPASNAKLFASGVAWLAVGPDAVLATRLLADGRIEAGTLRGDLVLVGAGDPGLSPRLTDGSAADPAASLARAVVEAGVQRVTGDLLLDDSLFDEQRTHPDWGRGEHTRRYQAPITALVLNDACIHVRATPGPDVGSSAVVTWEPRCEHVKLTHRVTTKARGERAVIAARRDPGSETFTITGGVHAATAGESGDFAVDDPTLVFGSVLKRSLEAAGVELDGAVRRSRGAGGKAGLDELGREETTLLRNVREANAESHNLTAACLLKLAGERMEGEGSWEAGERAVLGAFQEQAIPTEGFRLVDGSGLAESNRCTPRQVAAWLRYLLGAPRGEVFRKTLANGGEGTLKKRLKEGDVRDRVRMKTGYITVGGGRYAARALSGYVETTDRETLVVALLSRNVPSSELDRIVRALARL